MKPRSKPRQGSSERKVKRALLGKRHPAATTADIIPNFEDETLVPARWKTQYKSLLRLRENLLNRKVELAAAAKEEKPEFSQHMADAGTDHFDRDFALSLLSSEQNALYEVEQALNRIRNGTYGKCEVTNEPIPIERLKAIPWTRFSAKAEEELEKNGGADTVKFSAASSIPREDASSQVSDESK